MTDQNSKYPSSDLPKGSLTHFAASSTDELAKNIIHASATGNLTQLETLFPLYLSKPAAALPTPQYLLQTAAKHGQAAALRQIFSSLPASDQRRGRPWDPELPPGIYSPKVPEEWPIYEHSVIHSALEGSDAISVFKVFFDYGMKADINLERAINPTACAVARNNVALVRLLLEHGAKSTGHCLQAEDTYLGAAARQDGSEMLQLLIQHGANLEGSQALRQAVQSGKLANAQMLLDLGADVNEEYTKWSIDTRKDEIWGRPLHFAIKGTPLNVRGRSASKEETVRWLLARGAKTDVLDEEGKTPLQFAIEREEEGVVKALKEHGGTARK